MVTAASLIGGSLFRNYGQCSSPGIQLFVHLKNASTEAYIIVKQPRRTCCTWNTIKISFRYLEYDSLELTCTHKDCLVSTEFPVETTTAAAKPTDPPTEKTTEFPTDFPPDTDEYSPPYPDSCKQNITHVCK